MNIFLVPEAMILYGLAAAVLASGILLVHDAFQAVQVSQK